MTLQSSGPISLDDIQTEFGGANPIALSEYYNKGNAPASGAIDIAADFYGTSSVWFGTITSNTPNLNLATWASGQGWDGTTAAHITINAGVWIYSTSVGTPALTTGNFANGLTIVNNGNIIGMGGRGDNYNGSVAAQAGGIGLSAGCNCTIDNNSYIAGGGGGGGYNGADGGGGGAGGGDGGTGFTSCAGGAGGGLNASGSDGIYYSTSHGGCAGGGGGGRVLPGVGGGNNDAAGTGGSAGGEGGCSFGGQYAGDGGSAGNAGSNGDAPIGGTGGGGGWGASGGFGYSPPNNPVGSAAGGKAVALNGNTVTWDTIGTRYGAIS